MLPSITHICAANEHVPKVERSIRTLKERARTMCHSLPYERHTKLTTKALAKNITKWVNAFPSNAGISGPYSPANIVEGSINPDCKRKRIVYGAYAFAYTGTTNDMSARSIPAISLSESNDSDGQFFMSLETSKRFHSKRWTQLPIDDTIVDRVTDIAVKEKQPHLPGCIPMF